MLFRRGDAWRGQLLPKSGKAGMPVTYGAYGQARGRSCCGSVSRNRPADWHEEGDHVWATAKQRAPRCRPWATSHRSPWSVYTEGGARVRSTMCPGQVCGTYRIRSRSIVKRAELPVTTSSFSTPALPVRAKEIYVFTFRARSTKPFTLNHVELMKQSAPWTAYAEPMDLNARIGADWSVHHARFQANLTADDGRLTIALGGSLPRGKRSNSSRSPGSVRSPVPRKS